ncbi:MAG: hypothetical protein ABIZ70_01600 [Gemmatimonadales bacterium]
MRFRNLNALALALVIATPLSAQQAKLPKNGTEVLERMRAKYAGKWYPTLEFAQKTTLYRASGTREEAWHERLWQSPTRGTLLRIDQGDSTLGNYTINTADSGYSVRGGKLMRAGGDGNFFLPLIEGVYVQPVERTVKDLASTKIDLGRVREESWQGEPVWVVGASDASDTTAVQFWVEPKRMVVVRVLIVLAAGQPPLDVHLEQYVATGGGWLATRIQMFMNGKPVQMEEYSDWKTGHSINATVFEAPARATP